MIIIHVVEVLDMLNDMDCLLCVFRLQCLHSSLKLTYYHISIMNKTLQKVKHAKKCLNHYLWYLLNLYSWHDLLFILSCTKSHMTCRLNVSGVFYLFCLSLIWRTFPPFKSFFMNSFEIRSLLKVKVDKKYGFKEA